MLICCQCYRSIKSQSRAVSSNGTLGEKIWWLSPQNKSKHWDTLGCTITTCGGSPIPACAPGTLRDIPDTTLAAIPEGPRLSCAMLGGGGVGVADYIYPSLMNEDATASDPNFQEVGERATLFLVTDNCMSWHNRSGVLSCSPWDSDGQVHRSVVKMPVTFRK